MSKLHRLVYISRSMIPPDGDFVGEVRRILEGGRRRNAEGNVTGALLFNKGGFAQILEGELSVINETFNRIQLDRRHANLVVLSNEPITRRIFAAWSMAFIDEARIDPRLSELQVANDVTPTDAEAERICDMVRRLLQQHLADEVELPAPASACHG